MRRLEEEESGKLEPHGSIALCLLGKILESLLHSVLIAIKVKPFRLAVFLWPHAHFLAIQHYKQDSAE